MGRDMPAGAGDHQLLPATEDQQRRLKPSWPEVVGWPEFYAALKIINERPDVTVYMFRDGDDLPPPEHDPKRVAIFVDDDIRVSQTPVVG